MRHNKTLKFLLGIAIGLLLVLGYWLSTSGATFASSNWQLVAKVAPPGLTKKLDQDYQADLKAGGTTQTIVDVGRMRMLTIREGSARTLFLINTRVGSSDSNQSLTCGIAGCLFYGYIARDETFQQVLKTYISDTQVKPNVPLVETAHRISEGIPCIRVNAFSQVNHRGEKYTLCSRKGNFQVTPE